MSSTAPIAADFLKEAPHPLAPPARGASSLPAMVIERREGWDVADLGEVWKYRELLFFLTWRDVKVRYKQTALGMAWAVLQPLATMIVISLFFGRMAAAPRSSIPYPLFIFAGLLPWTFFANAIGSSGQSLVGNQNLITKVFFPRLIIPAGAVGAGMVDFAISFVLLLLLMPFFGVFPGWSLLWAPLLALLLAIAALGVGTLLSALTVKYRDFRHVIPFMVQLWLFATPSVYLQADDVVGPRMKLLLPLNPAHGTIAAFRDAVLGGSPDLVALAISSAVGIALLVGGCCYFRSVERGFADVI